MGMNRIIPYPPSFRRIAAKTIDPSKGASTWALGSHRWVMNIGIFTKNANIIKIIIEYFNISILAKWKDIFIHKIILIKRGSDAVIV